MAESGVDERAANQLSEIIKRINAQTLSVILTTQPSGTFKAALQPGSPQTAQFAGFWLALAAWLSDIPTPSSSSP